MIFHSIEHWIHVPWVIQATLLAGGLLILAGMAVRRRGDHDTVVVRRRPADKARVGIVVWALVGVWLCQKKTPPPIMTMRTTRITKVRKNGRDVFTKIPVQLTIFHRRDVQCG